MWYASFVRDMTSFVCDLTLLFRKAQVLSTHLHVTWLIYMWRDSFVSDEAHLCVTWLIFDVTWLIRMTFDFTIQEGKSPHDSFTCDVTHL